MWVIQCGWLFDLSHAWDVVKSVTHEPTTLRANTQDMTPRCVKKKGRKATVPPHWAGACQTKTRHILHSVWFSKTYHLSWRSLQRMFQNSLIQRNDRDEDNGHLLHTITAITYAAENSHKHHQTFDIHATSMTPSRHEIDHPTSSSSSSTSPTMTSSTMSSESVARQERWDLCGIDSDPVTVPCKHVERKERGDLLTKPTKNPKPNQNEDHDQERWDPCHSDIPEWLQQFRENLVDDRVPERRDSHASSSDEPSSEPTPAKSADLGKYSVHTHFPKDRNCEICQRTKITRASCRRRNRGAVPRSENFGDLITADHKVLSDNCESRTQSPISSRGTGLSHSMNPGISVQKPKLHKKPREACKSSWGRIGRLKSFTLAIP